MCEAKSRPATLGESNAEARIERMLNSMADPVGITDTKQRIVQATIDTIRDEGFASASARAIARRGTFNQALIFYHFGTLNELLLTAFDAVTSARIERYVEVFEGPDDLAAKLRAMIPLYREDRESGRLRVITEVIAGATGRPDLAPEVAARIDPWMAMTDHVVRSVLDDVGMGAVVGPPDAAFAISALFVGMDVLGSLGYDDAPAERLIELAASLAPMLQMLGGLGTATPP
jgi:AcrR family transcriptional regulator